MDSRLRRTRRLLIVRQSLASLADNLSAPYIGYYFASLTGSGTMQGILQMSVNSLPTVAQVLVGSWMDRHGRHVRLLLASSILSSLIWLLVAATLNPELLLALITARAVIVGIAGLALTALVAELFKGSERGEVLSYLNASAQLSALPVFALMIFVNPDMAALRLIFVVSGLVSLAASATWFTMLSLDLPRSAPPKGFKVLNGKMLSNKLFIEYTAANSIFTFAMAMAWPLFPLAQKYVLSMSIADLAILNLLSSTSTMLSQYALAKRVNKHDLLKLTLVGRAGLVMFPVVYALSSSPLPIYLWQAASGPFTALGNVVIPLYVMEVADPELKASYLSYYNLAQGIAASLGSAVGGVVTDRIVAATGWNGVRYGLALSALLRTLTLIPLARMMSKKSRETKGV